MACAAMAACWVRPPSSFLSLKRPNGVRLSVGLKWNSLKLSSSRSSFGLSSFPLKSVTPFCNPPQKPGSLTIVAAKGYKMKTHKASAKRFRVTGNGKIVRRRAGKQHLLAKKNTKRKNRLSKMHAVNRSDYDNVIGALPYLKVNRKAT
ncbi:50S ribosomal protein L35, chloroplastic [Amborella trichopoda]|uniref:50S ribosomal protein L35, chloroplastic n=1 Tax=Amborella trichopoda TaxID=13333 RepID=UPI0005D454E0|nr:50S ribosomal protein L35, chloroplastic [Amborella trichopoda]|eukprot:XP_011623774.1 50S ribosomal protein L35, chloroplastic [Amborella trichopoda]